MSSIIPTHKTNYKPVSTVSHSKLVMNIGVALVISIPVLLSVGCSTTQEFKPTASVIVGGHKSL